MVVAAVEVAVARATSVIPDLDPERETYGRLGIFPKGCLVTKQGGEASRVSVDLSLGQHSSR